MARKKAPKYDPLKEHHLLVILPIGDPTDPHEHERKRTVVERTLRTALHNDAIEVHLVP